MMVLTRDRHSHVFEGCPEPSGPRVHPKLAAIFFFPFFMSRAEGGINVCHPREPGRHGMSPWSGNGRAKMLGIR